MVTIKDLAVATENSYRAYNDDPQAAIKGFHVIDVSSQKATKENHSAVAYYNEDTYEVIVAHRGSVGIPLLAYDWLITDRDIALFNKNTNADIDAVKFTRKTLEILADEGLPVDHVYQTGHSKGGHEAQVCTADMTNNLEHFGVPTTSITFNAPGVRDVNRRRGTDYNHVNLRVMGTVIGDVVSLAGGKPLGKSMNVKAKPSDFLLSAHTMSAVNSALDYQPTLKELPALEFVEASKNATNINTIVDKFDSGKKILEPLKLGEFRAAMVERSETSITHLIRDFWDHPRMDGFRHEMDAIAAKDQCTLREVADEIHETGKLNGLAEDLEERLNTDSDGTMRTLTSMEKAYVSFEKHYSRAMEIAREIGDHYKERIHDSRNRVIEKFSEIPASKRLDLTVFKNLDLEYPEL